MSYVLIHSRRALNILQYGYAVKCNMADKFDSIWSTSAYTSSLRCTFCR